MEHEMRNFRPWFRILFSLVALSFAFTVGAKPSVKLAPAEWTILVYLNAKNNLEAAGLTDFYEMAGVGSSNKVNVVVQLGRPTAHYTDADGNWSGVQRFLVSKGMKPLPENSVVDLQNAGLNTDMADPSTLEDFIRWGIKNYPSKRRMLVIWNHGQGWRFQLAADGNLKGVAAKQQRSSSESNMLIGVQTPIASIGGYRAVSSDDDSGSILYNRQIQDVLGKVAKDGQRFNIVGFDACLMSMVETAYALRMTTDYMVASQELEPNDGWNYQDFLQKLIKKPTASPKEFSGLLVESYQGRYQDSDRTTLSAIDLHKTEPLAEALSSLSTELLKDLKTQRPKIAAARASTRSFADWNSPPLQTSIDLRLFLSHLQRDNPNEVIKKSIDNVLQKLDSSIIKYYRSTRVFEDGYGGYGLAIYFPRDKKSFIEDPYSDGYLATNKKHPLEFVESPKTNGWAHLVVTYLQVP